jgi:hypothetical protein
MVDRKKTPMPTIALRVRSIVAAAVCAAIAGLAATPVRAQSLADLARKEEERRQKTPEPAKVYTNKDLKGGGEPASPPAAQAPAPAATAPKDGTDAKAKDAAPGDKEKDPSKDPAYWSGKLKTLQQKLEQDETFADAMQTKINALTTDAINRDDPIQRGKLERDRVKAIADLAKLTKDIADDKKAIADFQELARRSGIPPGWLR